MSNRFFPNYSSYIITSRYGKRTHPVTGEKNKMHNGIDLTATRDGRTGQVDKIMAHTGGMVNSVGYNDTAGNYVDIRVDEDAIMTYRHLREPSHLKVGDMVDKGDIIGTMGKTGRASGAHLHWGIKQGGQWIDPAPYLDKDFPVDPDASAVRPDKPTKYLDFQLPVLKRGMKGGAVFALQALLIGYGYDLGPKGLDGSFGKDTKAALEKYQHEHDLAKDGSCGRATWTSLLGLEDG